MQKYNFMPRKKRKNKSFAMMDKDKTIIAVFLIIFSLLIYTYFRILDMKKVEQQKYFMIMKDNKQITEVQPIESKDKLKTISTANVFLKDVDDFVTYIEVNIEGSQIKCQFGIENEQEYYNLIANLEKSDKYRVKAISPLKEKSSEGASAEVILEVIK